MHSYSLLIKVHTTTGSLEAYNDLERLYGVFARKSTKFRLSSYGLSGDSIWLPLGAALGHELGPNGAPGSKDERPVFHLNDGRTEEALDSSAYGRHDLVYVSPNGTGRDPFAPRRRSHAVTQFWSKGSVINKLNILGSECAPYWVAPD